MLASAWLALAGLPVFFQPFPPAAGQTTVVAITHGMGWRRPCLRLRCPGHEWRAPAVAAAGGRAATTHEPLLPGALPAGEPALRAGFSARQWSSNYFNDLGIGTTLGLDPFRTADTDVRVAFGPALRLQPYVDDGTARRGLVARGRLAMARKLGDRARLTQQVNIEKGPANTFVRNSFGVDVSLDPQWALDSDIETTHDSVPGGKGVTDTSGTLTLRYRF